MRSNLSFFDAEGMRFHLPAYLVAELKGAIHTADVVFHLTYGDQGKFDTLSRTQREAVRQFLLLRLSDNHSAYCHPKIKAALTNYWSAESES